MEHPASWGGRWLGSVAATMLGAETGCAVRVGVGGDAHDASLLGRWPEVPHGLPFGRQANYLRGLYPYSELA